MAPIDRRTFLAAAAAAAVTGCGGVGGEDDDSRWTDVTAADDVTGDWAVFAYRPAGVDFDSRVFLRRSGERIEALYAACSHLGCPVRWVEASNRFICPCHGGVFDSRGRVRGGPPKRPLGRMKTRVRDDRVQVGPAPKVLDLA